MEKCHLVVARNKETRDLGIHLRGSRLLSFLFALFCAYTLSLDVEFKDTRAEPGYFLLFTANFLTLFALCCVLLPHSLPRGAATPLARGGGKSANQSTVARQLVPC